MPRQFLQDLGERDKVKDVFILGDKQLRQNRNGNLYLQMRLSDRSGSCNAMMWNADEHAASEVSNGDYVLVEGLSQFYNGALQIIVNNIELAEPGSINEEDFIAIDAQAVARLTEQLQQLLRGMQDPALLALAEAFLSDAEFMRKFTRAPAAVKNHHAYHSGLLTHVVHLMRVTATIADHYEILNRDLLLMGAFLHDVGKIDELTYERDLGYSDEGQLIGHLVMGVVLLQRKLDELAAQGVRVSDDVAHQLKHMIVSHHGRYEFGSPKVPMTLEAMALHLLDDLDAKLHNFQQLMDEDANLDSPWTPYHANLGRKLYKGTTGNA